MKRSKRYLMIAVLVLALSTGSVFAADYTVKSGDVLWKIADSLDIPLQTLIDVNGLENPDLIYPGQILKTAAETAAAPAAVAEKAMPEVIAVKKDIDEYAGADSYANGGDHPFSKYYVNPDFYKLKSDDQLTLIEGFKTYQQTSEWSCGSATILMVLEHYGVSDYGEWDIAVKSGADVDLDVPGSEPGTADNFPEYGTSVDDIVKFFNSIEGFTIVQSSYKADYADSELIAAGDASVPLSDQGNLPGTFNAVSLYASDNDPNTENWVSDAKDSYFVKWLTDNLKADRPIMVEWQDWDGHWQAIIGYDNNGTPGIGDDIVIFADPYDTSDSWQDGYYYYPLERWFYMWQDRAVAPKPYQLQPFVIVEPLQ